MDAHGKPRFMKSTTYPVYNPIDQIADAPARISASATVTRRAMFRETNKNTETTTRITEVKPISSVDRTNSDICPNNPRNAPVFSAY